MKLSEKGNTSMTLQSNVDSDFISHKNLKRDNKVFVPKNTNQFSEKVEKRNTLLESINQAHTEFMDPTKPFAKVKNRRNIMRNNSDNINDNQMIPSDPESFLSINVKQRSRELAYMPLSKWIKNEPARFNKQPRNIPFKLKFCYANPKKLNSERLTNIK